MIYSRLTFITMFDIINKTLVSSSETKMPRSSSQSVIVSDRQSPDYSIQALQRGMQILDILLEARYPLNLEQICSRTGLVKSTAFRILTNLLQGGYLVQTNEGYWLGLKLLRMGALVEEKFDMKQIAAPHLVELRNQTNETVHLGVLDHDLRVVYLEKLVPAQIVGIMMSRVGFTAPMHCTGLGKVMAAFRPEEEIRDWLDTHTLRAFTSNTLTTSDQLLNELSKIRAQGYAIDNCEHEDHIRCVAAPIFRRDGSIAAAVSVAGPDVRFPLPLDGSVLVQVVRATARKISASLGYFSDK